MKAVGPSIVFFSFRSSSHVLFTFLFFLQISHLKLRAPSCLASHVLTLCLVRTCSLLLLCPRPCLRLLMYLPPHLILLTSPPLLPPPPPYSSSPPILSSTSPVNHFLHPSLYRTFDPVTTAGRVNPGSPQRDNGRQSRKGRRGGYVKAAL